MKERNEDFQKRLLSAFKDEAADHLKALSERLIELEKAADTEKQAEIVETVFREAHSLKGAARAVNDVEIELLCGSMENVFSVLKKQKIIVSPKLLDVLFDALKKLEHLLATVGSARKEALMAEAGAIASALDSSLKNLTRPVGHQPSPREPLERKEATGRTERGTTNTVRVSTSKLNTLLLQAEEMVSTKLTLNQRAIELNDITGLLKTWKKEWSKIRGDFQYLLHALQNEGHLQGRSPLSLPLKKLLEFHDWSNTFQQSFETKLMAVTKSALQDHRTVALMVDNLLDDAKKTVMFPFSSLSELFPKLVRELSHDQGKDVELVVEGAEIEIDRRILEDMNAPMIHILRNCIDHGIETARERERLQKPSRGTIRISIAPKNGNKVEISVADDGRGIDTQKVRSAALKMGVLSEKEAKNLTNQELYSLIFQSGVSTSQMITDVSGRGLGLAIVQEKVERFGGTITLETDANVGTTFRIVLPLTLATFRGVVVRVDEHTVIVPTASIERTVILKKNDIRTVENRETMQVNGEVIALVRLGDALELHRPRSSEASSQSMCAVVLKAAGKRIAFIVDEILNEQEILAKSLGPQLSRVRNVAGVAVLGTGKVVPVLNVSDLMKSAVGASSTVIAETAARKEEKKKSVLVVEDSITARSLLKNILESAGYEVSTAVDGVDAYTQLKTGKFAIVVSDVDMPRMNGFDLAAKIRADIKLAETPVVLVTALESREDRERGVDVGANAYIVKSSFDQSNLLDVMKRLL